MRDNKQARRKVKKVTSKIGKSLSTPEQLHDGLPSDEDPDGEATQSR